MIKKYNSSFFNLMPGNLLLSVGICTILVIFVLFTSLKLFILFCLSILSILGMLIYNKVYSVYQINNRVYLLQVDEKSIKYVRINENYIYTQSLETQSEINDILNDIDIIDSPDVKFYIVGLEWGLTLNINAGLDENGSSIITTPNNTIDNDDTISKSEFIKIINDVKVCSNFYSSAKSIIKNIIVTVGLISFFLYVVMF